MQNGWHKWTKAEDRFLIQNYEWIGDLRLSEMFEERFPKGYPWTCKHIEKRRNYLGLKRTKEQEKVLRFLNCLTVDRVSSWDKRGRMRNGEVREWEGRKYIKINGKVDLFARHQYRQITGNEIPKDCVIRDGVLVSRSDHAIINSVQRHGKRYPQIILETKILLSKLNRLTNGKEN